MLLQVKKGSRSIKSTTFLARPEGFEPPTFGIGIHCDIQLRYERSSTISVQFYTMPFFFSSVRKLFLLAIAENKKIV